MPRRNHNRHVMLFGALVVAIMVATASIARAAEHEAAAGDAGAGGPSRAEFNRLQIEVREQKQLLLDMFQAEQQRYDMVLKIIRSQRGGAPQDLPPLPLMPSLGGDAPADGSAADAKANDGANGAKTPRGTRTPMTAMTAKTSKISLLETVRRTAALEGKVEGATHGSSDVYVYVEDVKASQAKGRSIEIKQEDKQFAPRIAVVQAGTNVVFPNLDAVYHNVFSNSPRNSFDLGSYRAGDKARSVTLTAPGVVEIFCNMHQKMSANILVVPSPLYAKVRPDGTFRIDNVPVGIRKVVAWSPGAKSAQQRVELTPAGAVVTLGLEREDMKTHSNKLGHAYGSYRD